MLRSMALVLTAIVTLIVFTSCSKQHLKYTADVGIITSQVYDLTTKYSSVREVVKSNSSKLTQDEINELMLIDSSITLLIDKLKFISDPSKMKEFSLSDITYMHQLAQSGYKGAYKIAEKNLDNLSPTDKITLTSFKTSAEDIDRQIKEFIDNPDNANMNRTLMMLSGLATIIIKVLPLVV